MTTLEDLNINLSPEYLADAARRRFAMSQDRWVAEMADNIPLLEKIAQGEVEKLAGWTTPIVTTRSTLAIVFGVTDLKSSSPEEEARMLARIAKEKIATYEPAA